MCYWFESILLRHYLISRSQLRNSEQANLSQARCNCCEVNRGVLSLERKDGVTYYQGLKD